VLNIESWRGSESPVEKTPEVLGEVGSKVWHDGEAVEVGPCATQVPGDGRGGTGLSSAKKTTKNYYPKKKKKEIGSETETGKADLLAALCSTYGKIGNITKSKPRPTIVAWVYSNIVTGGIRDP